MHQGGPGLEVPNARPVNPLLTNLVLYVDSATGSDLNPGTQAQPFATLQRAWNERQAYAELRATLRIQLIGAGPYDMPAMGASTCSEAGSFTICGDAAAQTVVATGTATGDFAANVLPTSATGGVNNCRDEFLRMLTGNCAQAVFQINENAANSITVSNVRARTTNGAIANGDTWQVVRPGTQIRITLSALSTAAVPHVIANWTGSSVGSSTPTAKHWLYNVRLTTTDGSQLKVLGAQFGLAMVRAEAGVFFIGSQIIGGTAVRSTEFGIVSANRDLLFGAGLVVSAGLFFWQSCTAFGVFTYGGSAGSLGDTAIIWGGGRGVALSVQLRSQVNTIGAGQDILLNGTITVSGSNAALRMGVTGTIRCAVTAGSCFRARMGGLIAFQSGGPTGGTIDAAGFGFDARGGGVIFFENVQPAVTGGTLNQDLRTTNQTAANVALAVNNTAVGDAADALLGEVLARVAA
jgi:hypothetical protein